MITMDYDDVTKILVNSGQGQTMYTSTEVNPKKCDKVPLE